MRFALVTADQAHGVSFTINPWEGDATGFMNWISVWNGYHFNYEKLRADCSVLRHFDVVMFSGHPGHLVDIVKISEYLKETDAVTMFYPEGSAQLFDNSINGFYSEVYDAWNACDIVSVAEEDKVSYYKAFLRGKTIAKFIHVPLRPEMERMGFFAPRIDKDPQAALVYGDNNPNHPLIAMAAAKACGLKKIMAVDCDRGKLDAIKKMFPDQEIISAPKMGQYYFLNVLRRCFVSFYPTEWIGTARHQISCAVTGTPCIGNHDSHTQRRLFPDLGCDIYDIDAMEYHFNTLKDVTMYESIVSRAQQAVEFYNLENTKRRFVGAVEDARRLKKTQVNVGGLA
jgi:hypothetical protein